jgi:hypothetical protein
MKDKNKGLSVKQIILGLAIGGAVIFYLLSSAVDTPVTKKFKEIPEPIPCGKKDLGLGVIVDEYECD